MQGLPTKIQQKNLDLQIKIQASFPEPQKP
jgi:hypothetical protein